MIIRSIELRLEPYIDRKNECELTLSVDVFGRDKLYCKEILSCNDMKAKFDEYFDFIFKHLREIMRAELLKKEEK